MVQGHRQPRSQGPLLLLPVVLASSPSRPQGVGGRETLGTRLGHRKFFNYYFIVDSFEEEEERKNKLINAFAVGRASMGRARFMFCTGFINRAAMGRSGS